VKTHPRDRAVPAGRTSDILTRLIGAKLTESWGQQIIADNRTRRRRNIAAELPRVRYPSYTLMLTTSALHLDLDTVCKAAVRRAARFRAGDHGVVLAASAIDASERARKNHQDLIALASPKPGKLNFATNLAACRTSRG